VCLIELPQDCAEEWALILAVMNLEVLLLSYLLRGTKETSVRKIFVIGLRSIAWGHFLDKA
jgi:hypothetical protein